MAAATVQPPALGRWLKRLRSQHDLTQEALAELANCSVQTIRFFESGKRRPSLQMAEHLARILEVPDTEFEQFVQTARMPLKAAADDTEDAAPPVSNTQQTIPFMLSANDLIGRQAEINVLTRLFIAEGRRLVSLTGMGGIGKTRLALQLAHVLQPRFADGAAFIPLVSLSKAAQIPVAIAKALGVALPKEPTPFGQLDLLLRGRTLLLVLDNFEHLLDTQNNSADDALALIGHLVQHHDGVHLLVTTRERLRLAGEQTFELGGLAVTQAGTAIDIAENEAVLLFVQRASQVAPDFVLTPANQEPVWRICTLLEGAPLAIELAAAWSHVLSPAEIADEIERNIDFLARGDRDAPVRHRSLRSLFDHSWTLLSVEERRTAARLAPFCSGFTRQAASAVCGATLSLLAQLVDKSMIRVFMQPAVSGERTPRYYIHGMLRAYLLEKLAEQGNVFEARQQHATYFAALAEETEPSFYSGHSLSALHQLNEEHANLRTALHWALTEGNDPVLGLRLAGALGRFWHLAGHWREGRDWLQAALAYPSPDSALTAQGLVRLGELYHVLEANDLAASTLQRGLALWNELQNARQIAWTLFQLGTVAASQGELDKAEAILAESLARYRVLDDRWAIATVLNQMSAVASSRGDYAAAGQLLDESLPILREVQGSSGGLAVALNVLGRIVLGQGDAIRATALFEEALMIADQRHNQEGRAWALLNLGLAYLSVDALCAATDAFEACMEVNENLGRKGGIMAALEGLAAVAAAQQQVERARLLLEDAAHLRAESGQTLTAYEQAMHDRTQATIRKAQSG